MWEVLTVLLLLCAAQFVVAPLINRFTQTIVMWPRWVVTDPAQLTPTMQRFIGSLVQQFHAAGFEFRCNVHIERGVPGVQGFQVLLVHPTTRDIAVVIVSSASLIRSMTFAIRSEFPDGTTVSTGSNPGIGIFPRNPTWEYENFPWVHDAAALCEAHRRILTARGKANLARGAPIPGGEVEYMNDEWRRSNERHVASGYRYPMPDRGVYAFTTKGAVLATWKLAWPVKQIRIYLRNRRARRVWEEIGMGNWETSPTPVARPLPPLGI